MKRGQMTAVVVVFIIVAAVFGVLTFSQKKVGKAIYTEIPQPEHEELPVEQTLYTSAPVEMTIIPTATPVPQVQKPAAAPEPKPCIAQKSMSTCYAARSLAQKQCPSDYICKPTLMGPSAEGCFIELTCIPPTGAGIKGQEQYSDQVGTQKQPYAAGYYRQPPTTQ
jgi:hypothetical protein